MGLLDLFRGSPEERLAKQYMAALRALGVREAMRFQPDEDAILVESPGRGSPLKLFLHNLRLELGRAPADQHSGILRRFAQGMLEGQSEATATYAQAKPSLMAMFKDDGYPTYIATMHEADGPVPEAGPLWRPFAPGIVMCVVEDQPNSFRYVSTADAARWGVTPEQVFADAVENARALKTSFAYRDGVYLLTEDDAYAASRLLCEPALRDLGLKGLPVVVVPDRHTVCVAGSDSQEGLAALGRSLMTCIENGNRLVSATPLVLTGEGWTAFEPPASVRQVFGNARRLLAANFWSEFKESLDKALAARGEDIYVAKLTVVQKRDSGAYETFVVWSRGVDTFLPVADRVMFFEAEGTAVRSASWSAVREVMGAAMEPVPGLPERYRLRGFPTDAQYLAMGAGVE